MTLKKIDNSKNMYITSKTTNKKTFKPHHPGHKKSCGKSNKNLNQCLVKLRR